MKVCRRGKLLKRRRSADQFRYYGRAGGIVKGIVKGVVFLFVTAVGIYVLVSSRKNCSCTSALHPVEWMCLKASGG